MFSLVCEEDTQSCLFGPTWNQKPLLHPLNYRGAWHFGASSTRNHSEQIIATTATEDTTARSSLIFVPEFIAFILQRDNSQAGPCSHPQMTVKRCQKRLIIAKNQIFPDVLGCFSMPQSWWRQMFSNSLAFTQRCFRNHGPVVVWFHLVSISTPILREEFPIWHSQTLQELVYLPRFTP